MLLRIEQTRCRGHVALTVVFLLVVVSVDWNAHVGRYGTTEFRFPREECLSVFHLGAESPARRSLVCRRTADGERKVIHWHASSPPSPPRAPGS